MRKIIVFALVVLLSQVASAQLFTKRKIKNDANGGKGFKDNKTLDWGYYLGLNQLDFKFDYTKNVPDIQTTKQLGFNVGLIGNLRFSKNVSLRFEPGIVISQRNLQYDTSYFNLPEGVEPKTSDLLREVKSTYVYMPLLIKFSADRVDNFRPFVVFGGSAALNLSANEDNPDDNFSGEFRSKNNVMFYEMGFGIDFYLHWFKFTPTIRGVFAIDNEITQDNAKDSPWTSNVKSMKTRGVFLNFTFQ